MLAKEFLALSDAETIAHIAPLIIDNSLESKIPASIMLAQFICESTYGKSELAQKSNNVFGMKTVVSGNTWENTVWDGKSSCSIMTLEKNAAGETISILQDFRAYKSIGESIIDHGMYLLHAKNGNRLRYGGINTTTDPEIAARILLKGGYSSNDQYADILLKIIRIWNLYRFDRR